jgi:uncharacterized protein
MERLRNIDWPEIRRLLDNKGFARIPSLLTSDECASIIRLYDDERLFRSTINMQRYRFGQGEYKYFSYPLPAIVQSLREGFYPFLVPVANDWMEHLGVSLRYPEAIERFLSQCREKKQYRPTPLVLRYEAEGYNTLHQDMYGEIFFPFQVVLMLAESGTNYDGGELVFVEQLPRAQSRAEVLTPQLGDAVIFTTNFRPVNGSRGYYRARMKHGVSRVRSGLRYTLGIIFHDAT